MARQAAERDVWFKFYPADWRGDEGLRLCSLAARGLWMEIMTLAHRTGGYLLVNDRGPDAATLARLVGSTPAEVRRLLAELKGHGIYSERESDGVIYSRRMVRDAKRRAVNRANGSQGGNPGLLLPKSDIQSDDDSDIRNQEESDIRNPDIRARDRARARSASPSDSGSAGSAADSEGDLDTGFEAFWREYPRKAAKVAAERVWRKLRPSADMGALIINALRQHCRQPQWQRDGGVYIPHAATWLNQRRWEDEDGSTVDVVEAEHYRDECLRLHGGECAHEPEHWLRMQRAAQGVTS
jgi:hypothetical protein